MKAIPDSRAHSPYPVAKSAEARDKAFYGQGKHDPTKPVHAAYRHHFSSSGSCIRGKLAYQSAISLGLSGEDAIALATSVECLHNASLVLDDLQDGSPIRRGRASVYSCYGAATAQGLTNCLVTASFASLAAFPNTNRLPPLLRKIHEAVAETVHGQTDELLNNPAGVNLNRQLRASMLKSGPLFSLAIELPLIAAGADTHLKVARHAGYCFGLAYQIADDLDDRDQDASVMEHGNIALMLQKKPEHTGGIPMVLQFTDALLKQTQQYAAKLPESSGMPLFEFATQLSLKIHRSYG